MKLSIPPIGALLLSVWSLFNPFNLSAQTARENFEDGSLAPFLVEISAGNVSQIVTPTGFNARAGTKVHRIVWYADNYAGTRASRSVEGASGSPRITEDGWYGLSFYAPESFPVPGKRMDLAQIICWHSSAPTNGPTIGIHTSPAGELFIDGRYGFSADMGAITATGVLTPKLKKGVWHDVIIYAKFARNGTGALRAWLDGASLSAPTVDINGINLGNGAWNTDTQMTYGGYIKWGPYCWDSANYTPGEAREIFYDEIAYQVGNPANGFDLIKPAGWGSGYALDTTGYEPVFVESFDTLVTGSQPAGWTAVKGAGTAVTVRDIPSATDKCMQFYDPNAATKIEARKSFPAESGPVLAQWTFRQNGPGEGHTMGVLSGTTPAVEVITTGGNLVYRDGAGVDQFLQAAPANIWYTVAVALNPATGRADIYVNGVRRLSGATLRNSVSYVDGVRFGTSDGSASWHLYISDVRVSIPSSFLEGFDTMTTGGRPGEWTVEGVTDTNATVREFPTITDKSVQLYDATGTGKVEAWKGFVAQRNTVVASWSFRQTGAVAGHRLALFANFKPAVDLYTTADGKLVYRNGAGNDQAVQSIPANVWYDVDVVVRPASAQADVYVNGVLRLSNASLRNPVTYVDRILIGTSDAGTGPHLYVKEVSVDANAAPPLVPLAANVPRLPIILKLDDMASGGNAIPARWKRMTDFAIQRNIPISIGIIANSLEGDKPVYFNYLKALKATGLVEFWFHGYDHREWVENGVTLDEFKGTPYEQQKDHFVRSQALAEQKLGFCFTAFGAPFNGIDDQTVRVMSEDTDMRNWLYGDPARPGGKRVLDRVGEVNIEWPTFIPNPERFRGGYLAKCPGRGYFVIQGHPNEWPDDRWVEFVRLVDFIQANHLPLTTATAL